MSVRFFKSSSISTGTKNSKFWDQSAVEFDSDYELISSTILSTATGTVTFDNLGDYSSTYKHLQIRFSARATSAALNLLLRVNGDTGNNYSWHYLEGNGSSVGSGAGSNASSANLGVVATTANQFSPAIIDVLDSYSTNKNKTIRTLQGAQSGANVWVGLHSGVWRSTSSITSISLIAGASDTWTSGSRFSLYGVK